MIKLFHVRMREDHRCEVWSATSPKFWDSCTDGDGLVPSWLSPIWPDGWTLLSSLPKSLFMLGAQVAITQAPWPTGVIKIFITNKTLALLPHCYYNRTRLACTFYHLCYSSVLPQISETHVITFGLHLFRPLMLCFPHSSWYLPSVCCEAIMPFIFGWTFMKKKSVDRLSMCNIMAVVVVSICEWKWHANFQTLTTPLRNPHLHLSRTVSRTTPHTSTVATVSSIKYISPGQKWETNVEAIALTPLRVTLPPSTPVPKMRHYISKWCNLGEEHGLASKKTRYILEKSKIGLRFWTYFCKEI